MCRCESGWSPQFRWAEVDRLSSTIRRRTVRGESLGGPGLIPGMECLRSITPLAHPILRNFTETSPQTTASGRRHLLRRGYSRSSTAIERPDSSGKCEFDSHRERQFRRAVEFGLSVKSARMSGFKSRPSRQMAGFPTRSLSVINQGRAAVLWLSNW